MTVRRVLECLQEQGSLSRADLTRETGISAPTVSKIVADLLESGLLEEGEAPENSVGRPGKRVYLARDTAQVIGVVLDGHTCVVVVASLNGDIDHARSVSFPTPSGYQPLLKQLKAAVEAINSGSQARTLGIGISTPGLLNETECLFSPNLHAISHQNPARDLRQLVGIPCICMQETRALCLSERLYGSAGGSDNFAMLDLTTGLGLGIFTGGELLQGHIGLAGELGHITVDPSGRLCGCGNHGCLETLATDAALATMVSERTGRRVTAGEVIELLRTGALQAPDELNRVCEYAAIAMAATINLLNPQNAVRVRPSDVDQ
ncbi:MAG: ROK family transcriptional regulator [Planctomycetaceae bacterium]